MTMNIPVDDIAYCLMRMAVTSGVDADKKARVRHWLRPIEPTEADTVAAAMVNAAIANKSSPTPNLCSEQRLVVGGYLPVPTYTERERLMLAAIERNIERIACEGAEKASLERSLDAELDAIWTAEESKAGMGEAIHTRRFSLVPDAAAAVFKAGTANMYRNPDEVVNTPSGRTIPKADTE